MTKIEANLIIRCQNRTDFVSLIGTREIAAGRKLLAAGLVEWRDGDHGPVPATYFDAIRWYQITAKPEVTA